MKLLCGLTICLLALGGLAGCADNGASSGAAATATVQSPSPAPSASQTPTVPPTSTATTAAATASPTSAAIETETPEATETPEVTETPEATETPEVTQTPEATETPEVTETPEATDTPTVGPLFNPVIISVAGNGVAGFNGDGLAPLKTALYLPQDVTVGPDGLLYIADWNNHRIRRIIGDPDEPVDTSTVETVAGTGDLGSAQDGPALQTDFNHPTNVCFDHQGKMIVAAWHNSEVKMVDLDTETIINVAGTGARSYGGDDGPANDAALNLPSSVVVDAEGDVIFSDQANYRIRMVTPDGIIKTIIGNGTPGYSGDGGPALEAELKSPTGQAAAPAGRIDIDSKGQIYIADTSNHVIRLVDTDGIIHTIAGNGTPGYSGDGGPAVNAQLNSPSDVAVGPDGTVYIADTLNNAIRMVTTDGFISTIAGNGTSGYGGDGGPAKQAQLNRPYGLTVSPDGDVFVADTHNHRIRLLLPSLPPDYTPPTPGGGDNVTIIPCTAQIGSICTYVGTGADGSNGDGHDRLHTDLYFPMDIEFTPSGKTYVLDWNNHQVREILSDSTLKTVIGTDFIGDGPPDFSDQTPPGAPGTTINLNHPTDVQETPDGHLVLMAWHNHKIRLFDEETGLVYIVAGSAPGFSGDGGPAIDAHMNQPPHSVLDADGNLFFIDQRNQRIRVIHNFTADLRDAIIDTVAGTGEAGFNGDGPAQSTQFDFPAGSNPEPSGGITIDANGVLYFSDTLNNRIRKVEFTSADFSTGTVTTIAGTGTAGYGGDGGPATEAEIDYPEDLEIGPDGNLYFADTNNNRVRMIDLQTGTIQTIAGTGQKGYAGDGGLATQAELDRPFGIAFDKNGDLYVSDTFNGRIRKINFSGTNGPDPIFPSDYRSTYTLVRDCRFSAAHGGVMVRVWANPVAAQPYLNLQNPLPQGSVLVKEEFSGNDCSDDSTLIGWRVMRKEAPGFDSQDGDWHWQQLSAQRVVLQNTKDTCITCHTTPDCLSRDHMCTQGGPPNQAPHLVLGNNLPAALLSISGTSANDVYAVGADPGDGLGPYVLHYDGQAWHRLHTGASGDLWWISDTPIDGSFYMSGDNGLILRYDPSTGVFTKQDTPGTELIYGIWGSDSSHIWAVGGDPANPESGGTVWEYDGTEWIADDDVARVVGNQLPTLFKVWGRNANDVYAVGRNGMILHHDGIRWTQLQSNTTSPLFTVSGNGSFVVAVGGDFSGEIRESAGGPFEDQAPAGLPQMNGVFIRPDGTGITVGVGGAIALRSPTGEWSVEPTSISTDRDFHAAWSDPDGGIWAVGGDLSVTLANGMLAYGGSADVGSSIIPTSMCPPGISGGTTTVSYTHEVAPLLAQAGCQNITCHGGTFPTSGYDLRTYDSSFMPGVEAAGLQLCPIVPGHPDESLLVQKIEPNPPVGVRMPNGMTPLTDTQIALIRTWILEGAQNDAVDTPTPPAVTPTPSPATTPTSTPNLSCDSAGIICTVAGTGHSQFDGDGKPALETSFYFPLEVVFDPSGRPLIDDFNNLRIRRLNADGTIETIMGLDYEGAPVDGALAVDTPLHHASDISLDDTGRFYVAGDHVPYIFRVGTDNRVFIVAGNGDNGVTGDEGPALQASFFTPFGVLVTQDGGFYVSDVDAHVIRYVDASGVIHRMAGTGERGFSGDDGPAIQAQLNSPTRMRLGPDGDLYFCDTNNDRIRKIDGTGTISTVAGIGQPGYTGDNGPAVQARLNTPYDIAFAPNGDLYVADTGNNVIRRIDQNGMISTVVGIGVAGFAGDHGPAANCQLSRPSGVIFDAGGAMWISDTSNQRIRKVAGFLDQVP